MPPSARTRAHVRRIVTRAVAVAVTAVAVGLLAACGDSPDASEPLPPDTITETAATESAATTDSRATEADSAAVETESVAAETESAGTDSTPAASEPPAPTEDAARPPDLAALALGLDDLPEGVRVESEEYVGVDAPGALTAYNRDFAVQEIAIGSSSLVDLKNQVVLFEDAASAQAALDIVKEQLTSDDVEAVVTGFLEQGIGIDVDNVEGRSLALPGFGDSAVVAESTFDTAAGRAEAVFVFVRIGRYHDALFLIAPEGDLDLVDAGPMLDAVIARLRAAPGGQDVAPPAPEGSGDQTGPDETTPPPSGSDPGELPDETEPREPAPLVA